MKLNMHLDLRLHIYSYNIASNLLSDLKSRTHSKKLNKLNLQRLNLVSIFLFGITLILSTLSFLFFSVFVSILICGGLILFSLLCYIHIYMGINTFMIIYVYYDPRVIGFITTTLISIFFFIYNMDTAYACSFEDDYAPIQESKWKNQEQLEDLIDHHSHNYRMCVRTQNHKMQYLALMSEREKTQFFYTIHGKEYLENYDRCTRNQKLTEVCMRKFLQGRVYYTPTSWDIDIKEFMRNRR